MKCLKPLRAWLVGKTNNGKDKYSFSQPKFFGCPSTFFPCGKCSACLAARRSSWVSKCRCEAMLHAENSFLTLTYDNEHLPCDARCSRRDIQLFLKRFRNLGRDYGFSMPQFRYLLVGEYGTRFGRPHYHAIIFGLDLLGRDFIPELAMYKDGYPVFTSRLISACWSKGFVTVDELTDRSLKYVSKYITKTYDNCKPFVLFSQGLGRGLFVDVDKRRVVSPKPLLLSCGRNDIFRYPDFTSSLPRSASRYLERFAPDIFESLKLSRKAKRRLADLNDCLDFSYDPIGNRHAALDFTNKTEQQKRKLDNEC